ncbi:MAG TPA: transposase [Candidatus Paceibacterota bacterium]|nr:transposase [Candidatus Paceibacterota bacterium]
MSRLIGIRHRIKRTTEGKERPTQVAIKASGAIMAYELESEQEELDFLLGRLPSAWRAAVEGEDLSVFPPHHVIKKKDADGKIVDTVPAAYEGFRAGDTALFLLGGSGDRFASALSRRGEEIRSLVFRIPAYALKARRTDEQTKEDDSLTLISIFEQEPSAFYLLDPADRDLIAVKESLYARRDAQKARIACQQRLRQRFIGEIFLSADGRFPEGSIEDAWNERKANDQTLQLLIKEEKYAEGQLKTAVQKIPVWQEVLSGVEGVGEVIAAGIIGPIGDVRRFATQWKFNKFCGTHVLLDGRFPRRRAREYSGYNPWVRQSLYLFSGQAEYRPDSVWGQRLLEIKKLYQEQHPEPVTVEVNAKTVKKYTKGHIRKMAKWRLLTEFVLWLYGEWKGVAEKNSQRPAASEPAA